VGLERGPLSLMSTIEELRLHILLHLTIETQSRGGAVGIATGTLIRGMMLNLAQHVNSWIYVFVSM
jgi:hypothetical protein